MTTKIYDYAGNPTIVTLPDDKTILSIYVRVLSGDETGMFIFTDGTIQAFESSFCRSKIYYDGDYLVRGDAIAVWLNFVPSGNPFFYSKQRQKIIHEFGLLEEAKKNLHSLVTKNADEA